MTIKFYSYNLVDQSATVITASNENASFPASNLKDSRSTKTYRSTGTSANIVFDFISAEPVDSVIIEPHKLLGYNISTPITIEANSTDSWGAPAFSTSITSLDDTNGYTVKEFASQSYRFWRIVLTSASYIEIGNIFIGAKQEIGSPARSIQFGWSYQDNDLSKSRTNRYGQSFFDITTDQKTIKASFVNLNKAEIDDFFAVYDYNKSYKPFYFYVDCTGILNDVGRFLGHMRFTKKPPISNKFYALYDVSFELDEVN